jgi:hypothetical protein
MKKKTIFVVMLLALTLLSACVAPAADATEAVEEVSESPALTVGDKAYTKSDLEALGTMDADYTGKDGETTTYTGVSLAALLKDAGLTVGEDVTFVASDGFEGGVTLAEAMECSNCIVAFDGESLRMVMPDFGGKANVKGVIEIQVE